MSTKFGLLIDFDLLKAAISTNATPEIVLSGRGHQLDKAIYDAQIEAILFKNKRPPYWKSTFGFDFDHLPEICTLFCIRLPNFV